MTMETQLTQKQVDAITAAILDQATYIFKIYKTPFPMVAVNCMKAADWQRVTNQPLELKEPYFKNIVADEPENERFSEAFQAEIKRQRTLVK